MSESANPFVSVVTVSLNAAASIDDTLSSVFWQRVDFPVEHICVDGGSIDGTRAIIDRWAARSLRVCRVYERDRGIFDAMNRGLRAARGEYVLFLNADDFLASPVALHESLRDLEAGANTNPDLIVGDAVMGDPGAIGIWRRRRVPRVLGRLRGWGLFPVHQGQFTRRRLLEEIGGFDSGLRLAADVVQYYDLERRFLPTTKLLRSDVAVMRAGGAANANLRAVRVGTVEIYRHLTRHHSRLRAGWMVGVKTIQSLSELRFGRCPCSRWFVALDAPGGLPASGPSL